MSEFRFARLAVLLAARVRTLVLLARRTTLLDQLRDSLLARNPGLEVLVMRVDLSDHAAGAFDG